MLKKNGFGVVIVIVFIALLLVGSAAGLLLMQERSKEMPTTSPKPTLGDTPQPNSSLRPRASTTATASGTKQEKSEIGGLTISAPQGWIFTETKLVNNGTVIYGKSNSTTLYPKIVVEIMPTTAGALALRVENFTKFGFTASQGMFKDQTATIITGSMPEFTNPQKVFDVQFYIFEKGQFMYVLGYEVEKGDTNVASVKKILDTITISN